MPLKMLKNLYSETLGITVKASNVKRITQIEQTEALKHLVTSQMYRWT